MNKKEKLEKLFNPEAKNILLSDFLAPRLDRDELADFLNVETEREMLDTLGVDLNYLSRRDISQNECSLKYYHEPPLTYTETERTCPFGIRWKRKVRDDKFGVDDALEGPFSGDNISEKEILSFDWPSPVSFDFFPLAEECTKYSDKIIVGGLWSAIQGDRFI